MQAIKDKIISIVKLPNKENNVYDLEVEDNHNFVANDIFVHNTDSVHVMLKADSLEKAVELGKFVMKKINLSFDDFVKPYGLNQNPYLKVKLEGVAKSTFYKAKKRYAMEIIWDGKELDEPEYKIVGLEPRRSDNPEITGKITMRVIKKILKNKSQNNIKTYVNKTIDKMRNGEYKHFDIAVPKGLKKPLKTYFMGKCRKCKTVYEGFLPFTDADLINQKTELCTKCGNKISYGNPIHAYAADYSNMYLGTDFKMNDKVRCLYVESTGSLPETHVIAIDEDAKVPDEIIIDMDKQIQKVIVEKVEPLVEAIGIDLGLEQKKSKVKKSKKTSAIDIINEAENISTKEKNKLLADFSKIANGKKSVQSTL